MRGENIGPAVIRWAEQQPDVHALVLIGSRVHTGAASVAAADEFSDWDFQVVTSQPKRFARPDWLQAAGLGKPLAYVMRVGRLGSAAKVSAVLRDGELDLVLIPAGPLRLAKWLLQAGLAARLPPVRRGLGDLAVVVRAGHRVVKGERAWGSFFRRVAEQVPVPRLNDTAVRALAEGFVCDYISTRHKIERGELLAAQRWLHLQLAEVNFQLVHELRLRRGEPTLPDLRRIERLPFDSRGIAVNTAPTVDGLRVATEKAAATLRELMSDLVPDWRWPL